MMLKQNFADQLKAQSEIWREQTKDYQERLEQAGEQARAEYKKTMEQMEATSEEARKLAEKVRNANEAAWKDMVTANQKAFAELRLGGSGFPFPVIDTKRRTTTKRRIQG
jgi:predicted DsbA family dithiol-disulfide isomerase